MRATIRRVGEAIRAGSHYLPLRNYAAALATTAGPKDYFGQMQAIYDDLTKKRWRYVKDPRTRELVTYTPDALYNLVLAGDGRGVGLGKGAGDCDCITALSGALLESIGFKIRMGISAPPFAPSPGRPGGDLFTHIFLQAFVPGRGWVTFDPVLYPRLPMGSTAQRSRVAFFDLAGNLISKHGQVSPSLRGTESSEVFAMRYPTRDVIPPIEQWRDYGPMLGFAEDGEEPEDWRQYGLKDFGCHAERMGIMDGMGLAAEVDYEVIDGRVVARTPMLELAHEDYQYLGAGGRPYDGLFALGDDGSAYAYDGSLGFFRKLWGGIKKVGKRIARGAKKLLKKTRVGSYLVKLGEKIYSVASKFVRPLAKFVGKYASKLAPVAALIPGWGPAIAAGLYTAGKVANLMNKYGVKLKGKKGKARGLKFKDKRSAKKFKKALKKAAKKQAKKQKRRRRRGMDGYDGLGFFPGFRKIMKRRRARRKARRAAGPRRTSRRVVRRQIGPRTAAQRRMIGARRRGVIRPGIRRR